MLKMLADARESVYCLTAGGCAPIKINQGRFSNPGLIITSFLSTLFGAFLPRHFTDMCKQKASFNWAEKGLFRGLPELASVFLLPNIGTPFGKTGSKDGKPPFINPWNRGSWD